MALYCAFCKLSMYFARHGFHASTQNSKCGMMYALYSVTNDCLFSYVDYVFRDCTELSRTSSLGKKSSVMDPSIIQAFRISTLESKSIFVALPYYLVFCRKMFSYQCYLLNAK